MCYNEIVDKINIIYIIIWFVHALILAYRQAFIEKLHACGYTLEKCRPMKSLQIEERQMRIVIKWRYFD